MHPDMAGGHAGYNGLYIIVDRCPVCDSRLMRYHIRHYWEDGSSWEWMEYCHECHIWFEGEQGEL